MDLHRYRGADLIRFFYFYQSPGLPETLATAYNPGMCLLALPVISLDIQIRDRFIKAIEKIDIFFYDLTARAFDDLTIIVMCQLVSYRKHFQPEIVGN